MGKPIEEKPKSPHSAISPITLNAEIISNQRTTASAGNPLMHELTSRLEARKKTNQVSHENSLSLQGNSNHVLPIEKNERKPTFRNLYKLLSTYFISELTSSGRNDYDLKIFYPFYYSYYH